MNICIRQRDNSDCGPACLASIAANYQIRISISWLRQLADTDITGTTVQGLLNAFSHMGFHAKAFRGQPTSLDLIPLPAIAHIVSQDRFHHYVVIYRVHQTTLEIMDPGDGLLHRWSSERFIEAWTGVVVVAEKLAASKVRQTSHSVFVRFAKMLSPHKTPLLQAILLAILYTLLGLSIPIYVQKIVDALLGQGNAGMMNVMGVTMLGLVLLQVLIGFLKGRLTLTIGRLLDSELILSYYRHLLTLPQKFFDSMQVGEIVSRITDAIKVRSFLSEGIVTIALNTCIVGFSGCILLVYSWKLATLMLIGVPVYIVIHKLSNRYNKKTERALLENSSRLEAQLVESIQAIKTIKVCGLAEYSKRKTEARFSDFIRIAYSSSRTSVAANAATELNSKVFTILVLWIGGTFVLAHSITPGELLSFYAILGYLTAPINGLIGINKSMQAAMAASDRIFEILEIAEPPEQSLLDLTSNHVGPIRFKDVHFRHGAHSSLFENLNLEIPSNATTVIVGASGSGKSTLAAILQKLYPVLSGTISIGNHPLSTLSADSLTRIIGTVPQKADIFSASIIENIAPGKTTPDVKRIIALCNELGMTGFIERLPAGFFTQVGDNGAKLSGGQRQRIALARALYNDPSILVLDEATASLDAAAEQCVLDVLDRLRTEGKTLIVITHRLHLAKRADQIVVMDNGKIVETGTHHGLLAANGAYAHMMNSG